MSKPEDTSKNPTEKTKKPYVKPNVTSEELMAFGALCNGTTTGGRKETTGAPSFCSSNRLKS